MNPIDFWKLSTDFSVIHAALLMVGTDPEEYEHVHSYDFRKKAPGYIAVKNAICNAILGGNLEASRLVYQNTEYSENQHLDLEKTLIHVSDLDQFVRARGMVCEVFSRVSYGADQGVSARGPYYSAKLHAANRAWNAVTADPSLLNGRSPKQALRRWLTANAEELGLLGRDGKPNATGIEEICKVTNWKPEGGATPTQSSTDAKPLPPLVELPRLQPSPRRESFSDDLDDEIPF